MVDLFIRSPDVPVSKSIALSLAEVLSRAGRVERSRDWDGDVELFRIDPEVDKVENPYDTVFYPALTDLHEDLEGFGLPFTAPPEIELPEKFIVVHPSSISKRKEIPALFAAEFPFPVVNVGGKGERTVRGAQVENGRPLWETAWILSQATLVIGICSSITQLASQIGCKTVMCHFEEWCYKFLGIRCLGGQDLLVPGKVQIERTVEAAVG